MSNANPPPGSSSRKRAYSDLEAKNDELERNDAIEGLSNAIDDTFGKLEEKDFIRVHDASERAVNKLRDEINKLKAKLARVALLAKGTTAEDPIELDPIELA